MFDSQDYIEDTKFKYETFINKNKDKYLKCIEYEKYIQFRNKNCSILKSLNDEIERLKEIHSCFPKNIDADKINKKIEQLNCMMMEVKENLIFCYQKTKKLRLSYDKSFMMKYNMYKEELKVHNIVSSCKFF